MTFDSLRLIEPICQTVLAEGYDTPTDIQAQTIPHVLDGRDVLGCAQTGTGKTAAFALPILQRLYEGRVADRRATRPIRSLILAPTRELAAQIGDSFRTYGKGLRLRHAEIYGGVNQNPQTRNLRQGVDILIATPGRLIDLGEQGFVDLSQVETFVLDEADRMLDMGFIHDIRRIAAKLPEDRQTLLFSATMPASIRKLAASVMRDPIHIQAASVSPPSERIAQSVFHVAQANKPALLEETLNTTSFSRVLVFTRTKHGADGVVKKLARAGFEAAAIHGNKTQANRQRALEAFRVGRTAVLVATDVASRGIDVDDVSHVINYDLPHEPDTYVHRIGRTARAGASGEAIAFCSPDERAHLHAIERLMRQTLAVSEHALALKPGAEGFGWSKGGKKSNGGGRRGKATQPRTAHPMQAGKSGRPRGARRPAASV